MTEHGVPDNRRTRRKQAHIPEDDPQPDPRRTDNRKQPHSPEGDPTPDPRHRTQQPDPRQQMLDFGTEETEG